MTIVKPNKLIRNNKNLIEKIIRKHEETLFTLCCCVRHLFGRGRRGHVDAALPPEDECQGHEGPRLQTLGRGDLQHEQLLAEGRHRHLRRRLHGRDRVARRTALHQSPLRLRVDPGPVVGGA